MSYWLLKSEPDVFSIEDLRSRRTAGWDGVRNYQARNFMKAMKKGDQAFFYHSSCEEPGIVGVMEVAREAYPDPTQFDPKSDYYEPRATPDKPVWFQVDVRYVERLPRPVPLGALRDMGVLRRGSRLSVQPVTSEQWQTILKFAR